VGDEDRVGSAFEAGEDVGAEVVDGADEVFVAHEEVGQGEPEDDGADPGADEACGTYISTSSSITYGIATGFKAHLQQSSSD